MYYIISYIHIMYHLCICTYMIIYIIYIYNHNMNVIASAGHHVHLSQRPLCLPFFQAGLERSTEGLGHSVGERDRGGEGVAESFGGLKIVKLNAIINVN